MTPAQQRQLQASLLKFEAQADGMLVMRGKRPLSHAQAYSIWRQYLVRAYAARRPAPNQPAPAVPIGNIPLVGSNGGTPTKTQPAPDVGNSIVNNPLAQGVLDAGGAIFGDPALGAQVAGAVAIIEKVAPAVEAVGSAFVGAAKDVGQAIAQVFSSPPTPASQINWAAAATTPGPVVDHIVPRGAHTE